MIPESVVVTITDHALTLAELGVEMNAEPDPCDGCEVSRYGAKVYAHAVHVLQALARAEWRGDASAPPRSKGNEE